MNFILIVLLLFFNTLTYAETRSIVPRADGEGSIGTDTKRWGSIYTDSFVTSGSVTIDGGNIQIGTTTTAGYILTADSSGIGTWQAPTGSYKCTLFSQNLGSISSTTGNFYKAYTGTDNIQTGSLANDQGIGNGGAAPYLIPCAMEILEVSLTASATAVSTGTVGATTTARITFYSIGISSRTSLGYIDIPIDAANTGVYNNVGTSVYKTGTYILPTPISVPSGTLLGWVFTNMTTDNTTINAIKTPFVSVILGEDS